MNCINIEIPDLKFNLYVRGTDEFVEFIRKSVFEWVQVKKNLGCTIEIYSGSNNTVFITPKRDLFKNFVPDLASEPKKKRTRKKKTQ